ncbi:MAG: hypothetical protein FWD52_08385 [Candidatus Bathyarchaeota archaeon]|nr:hypothetical protein [Candidatus Termiticorpusculum sp.]
MLNSVDASSSDVVVYVKTEKDLVNAVNDAVGSTTIVFDNDIALTESLVISDNNVITLTSSNKSKFFKLIGANGWDTIIVDVDGLLTLDGIIVSHAVDSDGTGITVRYRGMLVMVNGEISGNKANVGGVRCVGSFVMSGGEITHNVAVNGWGGGVHVYEAGSFRMTGGKIANNKATHDGGGVFVASHTGASGSFSMSGGVISNNEATLGGGVCAGFFSMSGGVISNNKAKNGGGVCMTMANDFTLSRGEIFGNIVTNDGGGIYISSGICRLTGGKIFDNSAVNNGGGVWVDIAALDKLFVNNCEFSNNRASVAYDGSSEHDAIYAKQVGSSVTWTSPFTHGYNNYDIGYTNYQLPNITPSSTPSDRSPNRSPSTVSPSVPAVSDDSNNLNFRVVVIAVLFVVFIMIGLVVFYFKKRLFGNLDKSTHKVNGSLFHELCYVRFLIFYCYHKRTSNFHNF